MKSKVLFSLVLSIVSHNSCLQSQTLDFVWQFGTPYSDEPFDLAGDGLGSLFITGESKDPRGNNNVFLKKFDNLGDAIWDVQLDSRTYSSGANVAVGRDGSPYVFVRTGSGSKRKTVLDKYDQSGNLEWTREVNGVPFASGISTDSARSIFLASGGNFGMSLIKYDETGDHKWTRDIDGFGHSSADVVADFNGNAYVTGDGGYGESRGIFVQKFDADGNVLWTRNLGAKGYDFAGGISADELGDVYIVTNVMADNDFAPLSLGVTVSKYTTDGDHVWTSTFGDTAVDLLEQLPSEKFLNDMPQEYLDAVTFYARDVAVTKEGDVFVAGSRRGPYSNGHFEFDTFIRKYSTTGELQWSEILNSGEGDYARAVAVDDSGGVFVAGSTFGRFDVQTPFGGTDVFVAKYVTAAVLGDFNGNEVLDVGDIDLLVAEIRDATNNPDYDLNDDGFVDTIDRETWVHDLRGIFYGDSNMDGVFDTNDLVQVFGAGEYEDDINSNSTWTTGDWNGDGEFDSSDLILALADGGYKAGPRPAAVPEPSSFPPFALAFGSLILSRKLVRWLL